MSWGAVITSTVVGVLLVVFGGWLNLTTPVGSAGHEWSAFILLAGVVLGAGPISWKAMK